MDNFSFVRENPVYRITIRYFFKIIFTFLDIPISFKRKRTTATDCIDGTFSFPFHIDFPFAVFMMFNIEHIKFS